jgi:hypothetical protein
MEQPPLKKHYEYTAAPNLAESKSPEQRVLNILKNMMSAGDWEQNPTHTIARMSLNALGEEIPLLSQLFPNKKLSELSEEEVKSLIEKSEHNQE